MRPSLRLPLATLLSRPHLLAAAFGTAMLAGAFAFQHLGGLRPCDLCILQRWPHLGAAVLGLMAAVSPVRLRSPLGALAGMSLLAGAGIAGFHVGVEAGTFQTSCAVNIPASGTSVEALLAALPAGPVARCDEVAWSFLGLSMAAWNAILSTAVGGVVTSLAVLSLLRRPEPRG